MKQYLEVMLDALIDTAKILPLLFVVYYLIELFEYKQSKKFSENKFLKGKLSPLFGSLMGSVPQCGFSVVSTDLFTKGSISVGALIAVYIATSDEAIPLILANPNKILWLLLLMGIKIVYATIVGYLAIGLYNLMFKKHKPVHAENVDNHQHEELDDHNHEEHNHQEHDNNQTIQTMQLVQETATEQTTPEHHKGHGCCHHDVETKTFDWLHPMLHCLKIGAFILIINILFGFITDIWVGHENLTAFLSANKYWQPILAVVIGLIPNCASSVVLTQLFLEGGLAFGALVAGLCVNAGLGLVVLFKQNKSWKENLFITGVMIVAGIAIGYGLIFI